MCAASLATPPLQIGTQADPAKQERAEQQAIRRLQQRDQQVKAHELAHIAASGGLAQGGPSYVYQRGPDGQNYAIGGEVSIDTAEGKTPEQTIEKAQLIRRAALAPADPSSQDRSIAALATQMEWQARAEQTQQRQQENAVSKALNGERNAAIRSYTGEPNAPLFDISA